MLCSDGNFYVFNKDKLSALKSLHDKSKTIKFGAFNLEISNMPYSVRSMLFKFSVTNYGN